MVAFRAMASAAAGLLMMVSGCSVPHGSTAASPSASGSAPSRASSGASTASDSEDPARSEVLRAVSAYEEMLNDLYLDPARPLDDLHAVAVAPELAVAASEIGQFRSRGYRQIGRARLVSASVTDVGPGESSTPSSSAAQRAMHVAACIDVSQADAVDSTGKSVVPPDRPRYLVERLTVVKIEPSSDGLWRVSDAPNRQAQSCDG